MILGINTLFKNKNFIIYFLIIFILLIFIYSYSYAQNSNENQVIDIYKYEGYKIQKIEIEGLKNVTKDEVLMMLPFSEGDEIDVYNFSRIIQILFSSGYFENIEVSIKPYDNISIILIIKLKEFPMVYDVTFTGNKKIGKGDIEKNLVIKKGDFFSPFLQKKQIDELKKLYSTKGYENLEVIINSEQAKDKNGNLLENFVNVKIEIKEPKRILITKIEFINNKVFNSCTLRNEMKTKTFMKFIFEIRNGVFQEEQFNEDLEKIKNKYYSKGYLDVKFENIEKKTIEKKDEINLEIYITVNEGSIYYFEDFKILGNKVFEKDEILKGIEIKNNVPYDRNFFEKLKERIRQYYSNYGYIFAVVIMDEDIDLDNKKVNVSYTIFENTRAHLRNIYIKGNTKTKDYVILRELMFKEGEVFNVGKITQSIYNLYNTQFFSYLDVQIKPTDYNDIIDLIIIVEEGPTGSFKFGGFYQPGAGLEGLGLNGEYSQKNLLGMGYNISTNLNISIKDFQLSFNFFDRWFLNQPLIFGVSLSYQNQLLTGQLSDNDKNGVPDPFNSIEEYKTTLETNPSYYSTNTGYLMDYNKGTFSFSLTFGKRWIPFNSLSFGTFLNFTNYNPTKDYLNYFPWISDNIDINSPVTDNWWKSFSLFLIYEFDSRDYILMARKGIWFKERIDYFGGILGGNISFIRSITTFNFNFGLFLDLAYHFTTQVGFLFNQLDGKLYIDKQNYFYINGNYDIRGWMSLGYLVGRAKFSINNEIEGEIFKGYLNGILFFDIGSIFSTPESLFNLNLNDLYFSYGLGLKLQLQQLPFRLYITKKFRIIDNSFIDFNPGFFNWVFVLSFGDFMIF